MRNLPLFRALFAGGALSDRALSGGALSGGALSGGALSGGALLGGVLSGGALLGGTLWVAGVSDVVEVRFFPALDSQIQICAT